VFELKTSGRTAREAITELLAHDHEVRTHLPFLSNDELCLVVVSIDFPTLLDHSIAALITWQRRSILRLNSDLGQ